MRTQEKRIPETFQTVVLSDKIRVSYTALHPNHVVPGDMIESKIRYRFKLGFSGEFTDELNNGLAPLRS
jgi:hypothetical protein